MNEIVVQSKILLSAYHTEMCLDAKLHYDKYLSFLVDLNAVVIVSMSLLFKQFTSNL